MNKNKKKLSAGFSLIELILYIALVAIFVTGAIFFAWDASYAREKAFQQQVVEQNARAALARIAYEIRRGQEINSLSANSLVLENGANDTTISLSSGTIQITTNGAGPYALTSNQVFVTSLAFTQPGSTDEDTKNINVTLSVRQANATVVDQFEAQTTMATSTELNSQFNQSRQFLIDMTNAVLSTNSRNIEGITIQNTASTSAILDQVTLSWTGTIGGENITEIVIGGTTVWTGSQPTGSTLNLTNYTLTSGASIIAVDFFEFDGQMDDVVMNFEFLFADGSVHKALLELSPAIPTSTPSPTPTPTPTPNTCNLLCIAATYSAGTCRPNVTQCNNHGETNLPAGNILCTGGANADTCCCAP